MFLQEGEGGGGGAGRSPNAHSAGASKYKATNVSGAAVRPALGTVTPHVNLGKRATRASFPFALPGAGVATLLASQTPNPNSTSTNQCNVAEAEGGGGPECMEFTSELEFMNTSMDLYIPVAVVNGSVTSL